MKKYWEGLTKNVLMWCPMIHTEEFLTIQFLHFNSFSVFPPILVYFFAGANRKVDTMSKWARIPIKKGQRLIVEIRETTRVVKKGFSRWPLPISKLALVTNTNSEIGVGHQYRFVDWCWRPVTILSWSFFRNKSFKKNFEHWKMNLYYILTL